MTTNLTEWWQMLLDDLSRLEPRINGNPSVGWNAAVIMANAGIRFETNVLSGLSIKKTIDTAAKKLGEEYFDEISQINYSLPNINSTNDLLFAMIYTHHLQRFENIDSTSDLINPKLLEQRPLVKRWIIELQKRMDTFCNNPDQIKHINTALPDLAQQEGSTLLERINHWLAEKPIEEKLITQFEIEAAEIINQYPLKMADVNELFTRLDTRLKAKEDSLREIAHYTQLIQVLKDNSLMPDVLNQPNTVKIRYPSQAAHWMELNGSIPKPGIIRTSSLMVSRTSLAILRMSSSALGSISRWTIGRITPTLLSEPIGRFVNNVSGITAAITPLSSQEKRRALLIQAAEEKITTLALSLDANKAKPIIRANDFKTLSPANIIDISDKVGMVRHMVHIQKCLEQYRLKHTTGLIQFSLSIVFKTLTKLLSRSFLRPLFHDKVLLTIEAVKLEKKLAQLIQTTEQQKTINSSEIKRDLTCALNQTREESTQIPNQSIYSLFSSKFEEKSRKASRDLEAIISQANQRIQ